MWLLVGVVLFLIGLVSFISLWIFVYKELKKEETETSKKVLNLILGLLDTFISPSSLSGFALVLSLLAILIGLALIAVFH
jgi:formate-dependent nitrite reductase membrane component NrfD